MGLQLPRLLLPFDLELELVGHLRRQETLPLLLDGLRIVFVLGAGLVGLLNIHAIFPIVKFNLKVMDWTRLAIVDLCLVPPHVQNLDQLVHFSFDGAALGVVRATLDRDPTEHLQELDEDEFLVFL